MELANFTTLVIIGLLAGFIGVTVSTLAHLIEMKVTGRAPDFLSARAVSALFLIEFEKLDDARKILLDNVARWTYGTLWGVPFIFITFFDFEIAVSIGVYFFIVWGHKLVLFSFLDVIDAQRLDIMFLASDFLYNAVYAITAAGVALFLSGRFF